MKALIVAPLAALLFTAAPTAHADIHDDIDVCAITSDPACLGDILHELAHMAAGNQSQKVEFYLWSFDCAESSGDPHAVIRFSGSLEDNEARCQKHYTSYNVSSVKVDGKCSQVFSPYDWNSVCDSYL